MPYWASWLTPHVFFTLAKDTNIKDWGGWADVAVIPSPPRGWTSWLFPLSHCEAGGGASGRWTIMAWYPPAYPVADPIPISPQPWFPIQACVNDRVAAMPVATSEIPAAWPPASSVVWSGGFAWLVGSRQGGVIQQWGHFPASDLQPWCSWQPLGAPWGWMCGLFFGWNWLHCGMSPYWSQTP
jgi:hypothetical protein